MSTWQRWAQDRERTRAALTWGTRTWTHGQVDAEVRRAAGLLATWGCGPGEVLALQMPKEPAFLWLHLAALATGVATLPIHPGYAPAEVRYLLDDAGCRAAVVADRASLGDVALPGPVLPADAVAPALEAAEPAVWPPEPPGDDALAVLCYTSGTTGRPKGVRILHRNLQATVEALHSAWRWSADDVLLHALPVNHIHGLFVAQHGAFRAGAHAVWLPRFDAQAVADALIAHRATVYMGVPTHYHRLLGLPALPRFEGMRVFTSGSAPLPAAEHAAFATRTGHVILERYGMTEVGIVLSNPYAADQRRAGTVGRPLPGVRARVVDPDTDEPVPDGQVGEIRIAGPSVFDGYHRLPAQTARALAGGEMHTGDLGTVEHGVFRILGRRDDLILTGGLNVHPREVERVLLEHGAIAEAAVFGLPDDDLGQVVAAALVTHGPMDDEALKAWLTPRLASFRRPRRLFRVDALPRNPMGKVQKAVLRARYGEAP